MDRGGDLDNEIFIPPTTYISYAKIFCFFKKIQWQPIFILSKSRSACDVASVHYLCSACCVLDVFCVQFNCDSIGALGVQFTCNATGVQYLCSACDGICAIGAIGAIGVFDGQSACAGISVQSAYDTTGVLFSLFSMQCPRCPLCQLRYRCPWHPQSMWYPCFLWTTPQFDYLIWQHIKNCLNYKCVLSDDFYCFLLRRR